MYKDIATNISKFKIELPQTIVPTPTETDYLYGFIRRYFCQKVSDKNGFVFEISSEVYDDLKSNPFWKVSDLKWRISGPTLATYQSNGEVDDMGVRASNQSSLRNVSSVITNIALYLPNLLQFHR
jgi:hypothetical protein